MPDIIDEFGPEHRLAVYGTLAPGRPNEHILAGVPGTWSPGSIRGTLRDAGWGAAQGYPGITLDSEAEVGCVLFESADLPQHWAMLDEFEGEGYERLVTTVQLSERQVEACVYTLAQ